MSNFRKTSCGEKLSTDTALINTPFQRGVERFARSHNRSNRPCEKLSAAEALINTPFQRGVERSTRSQNRFNLKNA